MTLQPASSCTQSPNPSPSCRLRLNGTSSEQNLINDLITETIDIYGQTIFYIPRTLVKEDTLFSEDSMSSFNGSYEIRAYCNTVDGWEGQGDLLSKFGIRIEDKTTFVISRRRFTANVDGTPQVGWQVTNLMNYLGQSNVPQNSVSVGLGNPALGPEIQANPSNYEIVFNGGLTATIVTATGTATPGAEWTFTGIWPANATGAPLTIRSKDYDPAFIGADLIVDGRPNEGDLIWAPFSSSLYEITFVEHEKPFYQLGKGYVWELKCELFQYSHEDMNTGLIDVDEVENEDSYTLDLTFVTGGVGNYIVGEIVSGETSNAEGRVVSWNSTTRKLVLNNLTGAFVDNEAVIGETSETSRTIDILDSYNMGEIEGAQNKYFEVQGDMILDFSEQNPFGDIGNMGDKF
jgi:hypothetical protein